MITDSCAIAIAIDKKKNVRLFSFERGYDYFSNKEVYYVVETIQNGGRANYGCLEQNEIPYFCGKVVEILNTQPMKR